jgi:hypothetical protein
MSRKSTRKRSETANFRPQGAGRYSILAGKGIYEIGTYKSPLDQTGMVFWGGHDNTWSEQGDVPVRRGAISCRAKQKCARVTPVLA